MTSTAQAHQQLSQIQDLVERFAILFPSWPSLSEARGAITKAKRDLDKLDAGQNPYSDSNPDPAGTAINRPYSFLHFMATTATATDALQLLDPLTGKGRIIEPPAGTVQETIDHYAQQISAVERYRGSSPTPTAPTPAPTAPGSARSSAAVMPAPAAPAAQISAPSSASGSDYAPTYSYAAPSLVNSLGPGGTGPTSSNAAAGPSSSSAGGTKTGLIVAAVAAVGVVLLMGKKKGGRR